MTSMTAVVKATAGPGAQIDQVAIPEAKGKGVLTEVAAFSIWGTDVPIFDWNDWARRHIHPPRVFGHEMSGRIVANGPEVRDLTPGTFVAAETHVVDHPCRQCQRGLYHLCENVRVLGVDRDGSFARYVLLPAENCWRNAPGLTPEIAALQEPFGNAVHAATAGPLKDNAVAIFGLGPIGLCAVGIARAEGAAAVYGIEPNPYRRELAERMGATAVLAPSASTVEDVRKLNGGADVDFQESMAQMKSGRSGKVVLLPNGG